VDLKKKEEKTMKGLYTWTADENRMQ